MPPLLFVYLCICTFVYLCTCILVYLYLYMYVCICVAFYTLLVYWLHRCQCPEIKEPKASLMIKKMRMMKITMMTMMIKMNTNCRKMNLLLQNNLWNTISSLIQFTSNEFTSFQPFMNSFHFQHRMVKILFELFVVVQIWHNLINFQVWFNSLQTSPTFYDLNLLSTQLLFKII